MKLHHKHKKQGLYNPINEHDSCGVGFVANIHGKQSHKIISQGLELLTNLTHRGATGYDPKLGDGAGILIQIPDEFFRNELKSQGLEIPAIGEYAVGMCFLPQNKKNRELCENKIEQIIEDEKQNFLFWRDVPFNDEDIADAAKDVQPVIKQVFIARDSSLPNQAAFERKLFVIRKRIEIEINKLNLEDAANFYISSMSSRTVVYKGMLLAHEVGEFFPDLVNEISISAIALVHQRFSTNTFPAWELAHPYRMIAHNGEINTLRGNQNWLTARQGVVVKIVVDTDLRILVDQFHAPFNPDKITQPGAGLVETDPHLTGRNHSGKTICNIVQASLLPAHCAPGSAMDNVKLRAICR